MKVMCETEQEYFLQHLVHQKMQGLNLPYAKCRGTVLIELAAELRHVKDEMLATYQAGTIFYQNSNFIYCCLHFLN